MAAAVRLLDIATTTSEQESRDSHSQQYSFKPISSPLTYSVRDSADSLDSDSTERSFGFTSRAAPVGQRGRFTGQEPAPWRSDALVAADSDIESDISEQQSPPKPRRTRPANSGLSVLPLGKREEPEDGERGEADGAVQRHSLRDSGLYSYSPSNNGEDHAMSPPAIETDVGPSRKLSLPDTGITQKLDKDEGHGDLVVSPSAVSVRMAASDEHNNYSPALDRFSSLGAVNKTQEFTVNDSNAENQKMRKSSSHRPIFLAKARESRLKLLQSGGINEFSAVAAEQLQRDGTSLPQSPSNQTIALGYRAIPITAVEQTQGISSISGPTNPRVVGRVVKTKAGSVHQVELHRPPDGPFGFVIAKGTVNDKNAVYVSGFRGGYPEKFFTGLLRAGDKIVAVNGTKVKRKSLDGVHDLMRSSDTLLLTVKPKLLSSDW